MFSRRGFLALLPAPFLARFAPPPVVTMIAPAAPVALSVIALDTAPVAPLGVVGHKLYRTYAGSNTYKLIATRGPNDTGWTHVTPVENFAEDDRLVYRWEYKTHGVSPG